MKFKSSRVPGRRRRSRSPCGERGLKYLDVSEAKESDGRSPCGERGLKFVL